MTYILAIGGLVLFFVLMSVRLILVEDGEFKGTCASQSPFLNQEGGTCSYCGKDVGDCKNKPSQSEVDKVMDKFK